MIVSPHWDILMCVATLFSAALIPLLVATKRARQQGGHRALPVNAQINLRARFTYHSNFPALLATHRPAGMG